jgi:hypothetical protein
MPPTLKSAVAGLGARSLYLVMVRAGNGVAIRSIDRSGIPAGCEGFAVRKQYRHNAVSNSAQ